MLTFKGEVLSTQELDTHGGLSWFSPPPSLKFYFFWINFQSLCDDVPYLYANKRNTDKNILMGCDSFVIF